MAPPAVPGARLLSTVLFLGAVVAGSVFLLHPKTGVDPASVVAHPEWTAVHLVGAIGFALVAVAAMGILATGVSHAFGRIVYGALAAGGLLLVVQTALDGGATPPLARAIVAGEVDPAVLLAFQGAERILGTIAFGVYALGGLGLALGAVRYLGGVWRGLAAAGALGFLGLAAAGFLVIGAGLPLSPLFAGGALAHAWLAAYAIRTAVTGVPAVRAAGASGA